MRTRRFAVDRATIASLCARAMAGARADDRALSIAVVADRAMRVLNREYHGVDEPTDVLAFPLDAPRGVPLLGEVICSAETAAREADRRGLPYARELALYAIHGTLHLLGYDDHDPIDRRRMRRRERVLLEAVYGPVRALRRRRS